jgi:hypothetical protein
MLTIVALLATVAGWVFASWLGSAGRLPLVPWMAVLMIWVVVGFVTTWALVARRRLHPAPGREPMAPVVAARTAALALAGSRTGAVVMGFYAGLALSLLEETAVAAGRERLLGAAVAALGGLALVAASLWLERICRLPDDPDGATRLGGPKPGAAGHAPGARA